MALMSYTLDSRHLHQLGAVFTELQERTASMQHMLSAVGDYWTQYYKDIATLKQASSGSVAMFSNEYAKMLDFVLSADIINIPEEARSQFDMLYFDMSDFIPVKLNSDNTYSKVADSLHEVDKNNIDDMVCA